MRNEIQRLPRLLAALDRQSLPRDRFEIVVVDDGSDDGTADWADTIPGVRLVRLVPGRGLPAGRNAGIRASRAPLIALTDGDCIPADDWLERGLRRFTSRDVDILAGGIRMPVDARSSLAALTDATVYLDQECYTADSFGAGANLWFRRRTLDDVGLFNESVGMYGDERDLCYRAADAGFALCYAPEVLVVHPARAQVREVMSKAFRQGNGLSRHRRFGKGALRKNPRLFLQWKWYVPRPWVRRRARLTEQGVRLGPIKSIGLCLSQNVMVQYTTLVGDLCGEIQRARSPAATATEAAAPTDAEDV